MNEIKKRTVTPTVILVFFFQFQDYTFIFKQKQKHHEEDRVRLGGGVEKKMRDGGGGMENGERVQWRGERDSGRKQNGW